MRSQHGAVTSLKDTAAHVNNTQSRKRPVPACACVGPLTPNTPLPSTSKRAPNRSVAQDRPKAREDRGQGQHGVSKLYSLLLNLADERHAARPLAERLAGAQPRADIIPSAKCIAAE
eukprot:scaffold91533_cov75-Phaeocystis_antarctica.AAC.1